MLQCNKRSMSFLEQYEQAVDRVVKLCPHPDKFAHTYAGLGIWVLAALIMRRPITSIWPLVAVVLFEVGNEYIDFLNHGSWRWHDTLGDMAATWFWPVTLMLLMRAAPSLTRPLKGRARWYR